MGLTTLGAERATNPFLAELATLDAVAAEVAGPAGHVRRAARGRAPARRILQAYANGLLERAGYGAFESPVFEDTELFARGVGQSTDIVQKEMFTFEDKGGRSLTLRPEGTAGVCRAYVEHGMHKLPQPVKLRYWGPFFRHEAPQAGRFRQFTQIGAEALGSDDPSLDAELILLLAELLDEAGVESRLRLSSLGNAGTRARVRRGAARAPARARGRAVGRGAGADRCQPAARVRLRPRGHARGGGRRAAADGPPGPRGRRALRRGARAAWTRPSRSTSWTRRWCAASTTTRARCGSSRARRWAPRAAWAGAGATTAWSSSWAARPPPASAGPRASSGSCWRPDTTWPGTSSRCYVAVAEPGHRERGVRARAGAARPRGCPPRWSRRAGR